MKIKNVTIEVIKGDITEMEVDAIVNAANNRLIMGGGVAGAIKKKGGNIIEKEAMGKGPIKVGDAVITSAGGLKSRFVIHAAVMGMDFKTDETKIRNATLSTLKLADENNIETLAFPAFGTGVGRIPYDISAKSMYGAMREYIQETKTKIKKIFFVLFDEEAYNAFKKSITTKTQNISH